MVYRTFGSHLKNESCPPRISVLWAPWLFSFAALVLACGCSGTRAGAGLEINEDIVYGMGYMADDSGHEPQLQPLLMDIVRPDTKNPGPHPAVILIHGGGFERGSKAATQQRDLALHLADKDYACFLINYRLVKHNPPAPPPHEDPMSRAVHAAVVDAKTALRHITALAGPYQVDPERVALLGASAGAITALAAGLSPGNLFADDGPEFPVPQENHPGIQTHVAAIVNLWGSADFFPELFNADAPPIMTVHGGHDFRVGMSLMPALNIDAQCEKYGIPHVFYPFPDAGHGVWDAVVEGKDLKTLITEFLDEYVRTPRL